ncbi:hypothetical protein [Psychromonas sp. SP041]|uniref:hypothetical protein n=1 Tax=Psychromonas sp. SP041 TaxID=1365007 RepID=UPI0004255F96|nr:hypothetical protein [Psychromonas sp. SP041]
MNKVLIILAVSSMTGCSTNMSSVPSDEDLEEYSSPNEFITSTLEFDVTGLGLLDHPHEKQLRTHLTEIYGSEIGNKIIFFRSYFTKLNDTHLYKPLNNAKAYCEYQGGTLNLVYRDSAKQIFSLDAKGVSFSRTLKMEALGRQTHSFAELAYNAWKAGAFGMHECVTNNKSSWRISILPYNYNHSDGSSDDAYTADFMVYVGNDYL